MGPMITPFKYLAGSVFITSLFLFMIGINNEYHEKMKILIDKKATYEFSSSEIKNIREKFLAGKMPIITQQFLIDFDRLTQICTKSVSDYNELAKWFNDLKELPKELSLKDC